MMTWQRLVHVVFCCGLIAAGGLAADQPQWGRQHSRNMVSAEADLPEAFAPEAGRNVRWTAPLGVDTNGTPVVAGGKVLVGTNRSQGGDGRDCGALLCFNEADGKFLWQLVCAKLEDDRFADWHNVGIMSPPTVEGDRAYLVTNRGEVVCLDLGGMANGNDGPFRDEPRRFARPDRPSPKALPTDADIIWLYDMRYTLGARQHNGANGSVLLHGRLLYVSTSNGVNSTHRSLDAPEAPSLIVLDKETGRLVAVDDAGIGSQIFHGTWSSPSLGKVGDRTLVFFGGGDGVCYAFEALTGAQALAAGEAGAPRRLKVAWKFHCDPNSRSDQPHQYHNNRREGPSTIIGMPVFHDGRVYVTAGGDPWHGKQQAWLKCIDPRGVGDITKTGQVWSYELGRHCTATPAIHDGLVYVGDFARVVHCVDAATGRAQWTHKTDGEIWGSCLVADGKVYVGTMRGTLWVFAAGREMKVLHTANLVGPITCTPTAAHGTLYAASAERLYALAKGEK